mmetsp:Transcript_133851/g.416309  ORF Transcript_133851/g.416309 Transcript_133851/m.416309 type:complete len:288 (-) Transcript_133851:273-1136(-)
MFLFLELVPIKLTHPLHLHDQRDDGHWQDDRHCKQDADDGGPVPPVPCHLLKELGRVRQGKEAEHGPGAQCLQCQSASADVHGPREVQQAEAGMLHEEVGPRHATAAEPGAPREEEHEVPKQAGEHQAEHRKLEPADAQCGCMEVGQWLPGIVAVDEIDGMAPVFPQARATVTRNLNFCRRDNALAVPKTGAMWRDSPKRWCEKKPALPADRGVSTEAETVGTLTHAAKTKTIQPARSMAQIEQPIPRAGGTVLSQPRHQSVRSTMSMRTKRQSVMAAGHQRSQTSL